MPHILNIRFQSIGHSRARMESLTIPFADLMGLAGNTIISLRNGGGKTALLGLIFWLLYPDGKMPDNRGITDYIQENDCSFIIIEWQLDGTESSTGKSQKYLTGACCEFRPHSARSSKEDLRCLYFAGKVLPEEPRLSLEGLPLALSVQGQTHQRLLGSFRREWLELGTAYSHAEIVITEHQREWKQILEHAGIDPTLFAYQITMNAHEAGVGDLFKFKTSEQFLDLFFEITANATTGAQVAQLIESFQKNIKKQQEHLIPEHQLLEKILKHLAPLLPVGRHRQEHYHRVLQLDDKRLHFCKDIETFLSQLAQQQEQAMRQRDSLHLQAQQHTRKKTVARGSAAYMRLQALQLCQHRLEKEYTTFLEQKKKHQQREHCWEMAAPLYLAQQAKKQREYLCQRYLPNDPLR